MHWVIILVSGLIKINVFADILFCSILKFVMAEKDIYAIKKVGSLVPPDFSKSGQIF